MAVDLEAVGFLLALVGLELIAERNKFDLPFDLLINKMIKVLLVAIGPVAMAVKLELLVLETLEEQLDVDLQLVVVELANI